MKVTKFERTVYVACPLKAKSLIPLLLLLFLSLSIPAVIADIYPLEYSASSSIGDKDLRRIAIERNLIPEDWKDMDLSSDIEEANTIVMWIIMSHQEKLQVVEGLKRKFAESGVIIKHPSQYYTAQINGIIYKNMLRDDISSTKKKGLGNIFKMIALVDGDFDNGQDKLGALEEFLGPESFEEYKKVYPDKYRRLLMMREE